jgi:integrase
VVLKPQAPAHSEPGIACAVADANRLQLDLAFIRWLTNAQMKRAQTAYQYAYNVRLIQEYFFPTPLEALTTDALLGYTYNLAPSGSLRNMRRAAAVAYFDYKGITPNPAKELPCWPHHNKLPVALDEDKAVVFLAAALAHSDFYGTMVAVLLFTGVRISEALSFEWKYVFEECAYVIKKGGQQRIVWFCEDCSHYLDTWRYIAPPSRYVFSSPTMLARGIDQPITRQTAYLKLKGIAEEVGIQGFHPHVTRHIVAIDVARETGSPLAVMAVLDHTNLQSSMVYLRALGQDVPALLSNLSYGRRRHLHTH